MARILVIEDNPVNMKLASLLLRNAGHTVLCAVDAESGLVQVHADRPDLVLMDLQLPGMSGMEAAMLLKHDPVTAKLPIIALTAMSADLELRQLLCFDAYVAKPLRYQELYATIDILLTGTDRPRTASVPPLHYTASTDAAVDVEVLKGLIGDDSAVVFEFLHTFQVGAAAIALELRIACVNHQPTQVGRQAHKLKSSAQTAGALALGKLCAEMESAGRAGDSEALMALLPAFECELLAVNRYLDSVLA
jgi:CheY-like chemotaxis protein